MPRNNYAGRLLVDGEETRLEPPYGRGHYFAGDVLEVVREGDGIGWAQVVSFDEREAPVLDVHYFAV